MKKNLLFSGLTALLITLLTIGIYESVKEDNVLKIEHIDSPTHGAVLTMNNDGEVVPLDFTKSAEKVMDAVVHIQSTKKVNGRNVQPQMQQIPDPFRDFFQRDDSFSPFFRFENNSKNRRPQVRMGTGSGVIINEDGYIVTNNHVVADADDLEVTLHDNRTYKATVIGTDPSTDLALIQVKGKNLPTLPLVNSDKVKIGEWVLAVGNPMGLNSTVTAGIVSAKGRNINILKEQFAVESFIQTDAAINPGNSGGALVNLEGGLIGINTAIASPTGSYSGYGFAVPTNIVSKVVEDLLKYGMVQRGVLGVMIRNVTGNLANEKDLTIRNGVYVDSLLENSAGGDAGILPGDVIVQINDKKINTSPELQEMIARHRPGDKLMVTVNRKGEEKELEVVLNARNGGKKLAKKEHAKIFNLLGGEFQTVEGAVADELDLKGGVKVLKLYPGKLRKDTQMEEGFIITHVNGVVVKDTDDLVSELENYEGGVMLEGVYEDLPGKHFYAFGL